MPRKKKLEIVILPFALGGKGTKGHTPKWCDQCGNLFKPATRSCNKCETCQSNNAAKRRIERKLKKELANETITQKRKK